MSILGQSFGRLTVVALDRKDLRHRSYYKCACACGSTVVVQGGLLRSGNTRSCGCLARDVKAAKRLPNDAGVINHIVLQYRRHAETRGLVYALPRAQFEALLRAPCSYCGVEWSNLKRTKNCVEGFRHNGVDRVDSSRGYLPDNVVAACAQCNRAKGTMSREQFIVWASRVAAMAAQWG